LSDVIYESIGAAALFVLVMMVLLEEELDIGLIIGSIIYGIVMVIPTRFNEHYHRRILIKYLMKENKHGK